MTRAVVEWVLLVGLLGAELRLALPRGDAAAAEIGHLFSLEKPTPGQLIRAGSILSAAQCEAPERGRAIVAALLRSADSRVRRRALDALRDQLRFHFEYAQVYRAWEAEQTDRTLGELADRVLPIRAKIAELEAAGGR